ncbi:Glycosyltransferase involved in cell wall bisynthesis [Sanguibacter gelidistatuariae]|uniref:Glycosyltransferase involved in cell wall bisynthesis n=1 Tax=Sanguibacter gelidistatuariae TaxID=1814289 RepID=A0A1G6XVZ3_9MICO|nr:glycosyltransferase [Sanguibacter gelidistatuariae]SDD82151.1 Glycosyltransferase involved in cell wall bisynthesis [Sanguibacter gelidistatuariae]
MIFAFGTYEAARHPRIGILIDGLRVHGYDVAELNHPLGISTAERVRMLKEPWRLPVLAWRLLKSWSLLGRDVRALKRRGLRPSAVVVGYMGHFDVLLARVLFRGVPIVLDHLLFAGDTARDRGTGGLKAFVLSALDRTALRCASIALVDTEEHLQMLPQGTRGVVVPVGARAEWFDAATEASTDDGLSIVFFGMFTPLQGAAIIAEALEVVLQSAAQLHVTMIGSGQDSAEVHRRLDRFAAVTWHSWVDPHELPSIVAAHDLCLGIFADTPKAMRVVPNKVYEGIAAGCAVITSDTAPQRRTVGDIVALVPAADPQALAREITRLAEHPAAVNELRARSRAAAEQFSATQVVLPLLTVLRLEPRRQA